MSGKTSADIPTSKVEFDVDLTCESCGRAVQNAFNEVEGIKNLNIDVNKQSVIVESSLPSEILKEVIETTGKKAVLKGFGLSKGNVNLGSAVAEIKCCSTLFGVVRFHQIDPDTCVIDGTIDGLPEGDHGLHIHEFGDLSNGCNSIGDHYNPTNSSHGGRLSTERHYGDLGNIYTDKSGRSSFRFEDSVVKVWDIIGRSLAVSEEKDDLGVAANEISKLDGNSGESLACAIIARSAGLFENPKRLCQCDGVSIWEEREVPSAGGRRNEKKIT